MSHEPNSANVKVFDLLSRELWCSTIMGCGTSIIAVQLGGIELLLQTVAALNELYSVYFLAMLFLISLAVTGITKPLSTGSSLSPTLREKLFQVFDQVGLSIVGVYRTVAGVSAFILLLILQGGLRDIASIDWAAVTVLLIWSIVCWLTASAFCAIHHKIKYHQ